MRQLFAKNVGYLPKINMNATPEIRKNSVKNSEFQNTSEIAAPRSMYASGNTMLNATTADGVMFKCEMSMDSCNC